MKKLLAFILATTLLLVLCACGEPSVEQPTESATTQPTETTAPAPGELMVGYARLDITPSTTTPLKGFDGTSARMATTVIEPLCVTCTAITDDKGNTVLMISVDLIHSEFVDSVRSDISEKTGVPMDRIYITATHTHAGPELSRNFTYRDYLFRQVINSTILAMADRKPAQMSYGSIETENMTFNRHYQYQGSDGKTSYSFGSVGALVNAGNAEHVDEGDPTMHLIRFAREGGKDVVMVNWRAHPLLHSNGSRHELSADFVGPFRTAVELTEDCHFIYLQGASGNMNSITAIPSESRTMDINIYGKILADYVSECLTENMQPAEEIGIKTTYNILSIQSALELNAISIGESVAFVTAPNELFYQTTEYAEENSPYPMTFGMGYTNGSNGYVPTAKTYEFGDYTWYEVDATRYEAGTAEKIQEIFVDLLKELSTAEVQTQQNGEVELAEPDLVQIEAMNLYWNIDRLDYAPRYMQGTSSRKPQADGYYHVLFAGNGKQETLLVKDMKLIEVIDFNDIVGLTVDENGVVTDAKAVQECTGGWAANRSIVMGVDGNTISCNTAAEGGVDFTLTISAQTKVYDVSTADETCGAETTLRTGDQIIALYDTDDAISYVFVLRRAQIEAPAHEDHCICGGAAEGIHGECAPITDWIAWGDDPAEWDVLPTESGRYYLTRDVVMPRRSLVLEGEDITICLNGHKVQCDPERLIAVLGTLSICDCRYTCVDGEYTYEGYMVTGYTTSGTAAGGALYVYKNAVLNLYSGTITSIGIPNNGGLLYTASGSTTNIYNATLIEGRARGKGGNIYMASGSNVNIFGGLITKGNASTGGCGIYVNNANLCISGAPKIIGNTRQDIFLNGDCTITIGEGGLKPGAQIGVVTSSGTGVIATNASKADAKYFTVKDKTVSWNSKANELFIEG